MRRIVLLTLVSGWLLSACGAAPSPTPAAPTLTPSPARTAAPTATGTPDALSTQDAERYRQTVQAYQTETAGEKATERALETIAALSPIAALSTGPVFQVTFSPDGQIAVLLTADKTLLVSTSTLDLLAEIDGEAVRLAFSPTGRGFTTAGLDGGLMLFPDFGITAIPLLAGADVQALAYSPDGTRLVAAGQDGALTIFDADSGAILQAVDSAEVFGLDQIPQAIWFSPDGAQAAVFLPGNSTLWLGDAAGLLNGTPSGSLIAWPDHAGPIAEVRIAPDWSTLAWVSRGTLQLMQMNGEPIGEAIQHSDWLTSLTFVPQRDLLLAATMLFDGESPLGMLVGYNLRDSSLEFEQTLSAPITALAVSPDGLTAAAGLGDGALLAWNLDSGERAFESAGGGTPVQWIAFSPDGALLVSVDGSPQAVLRDPAAGSPLAVLDLPNGTSFWGAFGPDGALLVVSDAGEAVLYGQAP